MEVAKQTYVKGRVEIELKLLTDPSRVSIVKSLHVKWAPSLLDGQDLFPLLELSILSVSCCSLPLPTRGHSGAAAAPPWTPRCAVQWRGVGMGSTQVLPCQYASKRDTSVPLSADSSSFFLALPSPEEEADAEEAEGGGLLQLAMQLWDDKSLLGGVAGSGSAAAPNSSSASFLGSVTLSLSSLLYLHDGTFALPLTVPRDGHAAHHSAPAALQGFLHFSIRLRFPFFDSAVVHEPKLFTKTLQVVSGANIPLVQGNRKGAVVAASSKDKDYEELVDCHISIQLDKKVLAEGTSTAIASTAAFPSWAGASTELQVDLDCPPRVLLIVSRPAPSQVHLATLDHHGKETVVGQSYVDAEYLTRPQHSGRDLEIVLEPPPAKHGLLNLRHSESASDAQCGSLVIRVGGSNEVARDFLPFNAFCKRPVAIRAVKDVSSAKSGGNGVGGSNEVSRDSVAINGVGSNEDSQVLVDSSNIAASSSVEERTNWWFGSTYNFDSPHALLSSYKSDIVDPDILVDSSQWLMLPIASVAVQVGAEKSRELVGKHPANRFSLCIERERGRESAGDAAILGDISQQLASCVLHLQRKDILRCLRARVIKELPRFLERYLDGRAFNVPALLGLVNEALQICLPGARVSVALASKDHNVLQYSLFDPNKKGSVGSLLLQIKQQAAASRLVGKLAKGEGIVALRTAGDLRLVGERGAEVSFQALHR
jgi:hypothetical protein